MTLREHLIMFGDIFGCHSAEEEGGRPRKAAPTVTVITPFSSPQDSFADLAVNNTYPAPPDYYLVQVRLGFSQFPLVP